MLGQLVSSLGLILDIAGALLIWRFGLPPAVSRDGRTTVAWLGADKSEIEKSKLYDRLSHLGVGLLVSGFLFQLLGLWVPNIAGLWN